MTPDDRRSAIVDATLPLLREHGNAVTTRQIAEACGIGEGTIFRVFADKAAIIEATLLQVFDPAPELTALAAVDPSTPLTHRLLTAVEILQSRLRQIGELLMALGRTGSPRIPAGEPSMRAAQHEITAAMTRLLEPSRAELRIAPDEAARVIRLLTFAGTHTAMTDGQPLAPEEIVDIVLHGIAKPGKAPACC